MRILQSISNKYPGTDHKAVSSSASYENVLYVCVYIYIYIAYGYDKGLLCSSLLALDVVLNSSGPTS